MSYGRFFILIVLSLIIYAQTFGFGFVFDDDQFIVNNPYIRSLDKAFEDGQILPFTRFLGVFTFALNYQAGGLNPFVYHFFNVCLHVLVALLVWALAGLLLRIAPLKDRAGKDFQNHIPFLVALIYLVHPLQTQAVSYISQRFESLATLCYVSCVYCYLQARLAQHLKFRIVLFISSGALALLGLLAKETVITLPLMLLAAEYIFANTLHKKQHKVKPLFILLGVFLFFWIFMKLMRGGWVMFYQAIPSQSHEGDTITFGSYVLTQMRVLLTFLRLLVFPVNQMVEYDYPISTGIVSPPLTFVGILVMGAITFLVIKLRKSWPVISFGLAWGLITFSINMAPRSNVIFEHKLYLISFGFILAAVCGLYLLFSNKKLFLSVIIVLIAILSFLSFYRNKVWQNDLTLWQDNIDKAPHKTRVYVNLAKSQVDGLHLQQGISWLNERITKDPDNYGLYMARGAFHYRLGHVPDSIADIKKAISLRENFVDYYKLAVIYLQGHQEALAVEALNNSLRLNDRFLQAYIDRGLIRISEQKLDEAIMDFNKVLEIYPNSIQALINRAGVYMTLKRYEEALQDLSKAQAIEPDNPKIIQNKAYCMRLLESKKK